MTKRILKAVGALCGLALVAVLGLGCGKVSKYPLQPLVPIPPVQDNFDQGLGGWALFLSQLPNNGIPVGTLDTWVNDITFQGSPGALKQDVIFHKAADNLGSGLDLSPAQDFHGKYLSMWIFWDSGLTSSDGKVIAKFFIASPTTAPYWWANGPECTLQQGRWVQVTWSVDTPSSVSLAGAPSYDWIEASVPRVGVQLWVSTGLVITPGTVYMDDFAY